MLTQLIGLKPKKTKKAEAMLHFNRKFLYLMLPMLLLACSNASLSDASKVDLQQITAGKEFRFVYSSNLNGELEPCGCTPAGDLGGIARQVAMVDRLRTETPGLINIHGGGLLDINSSAEQIKNNYILKGMLELGFDAIAVQWRDMTFGTKMLKSVDLPFVSSNFPADGFMREKIFVRDAQEFVYFALLDPAAYPLMQDKASFKAYTAGINQRLEEAKKLNRFTILTTVADEDWLVDAVDLSLVNLLIVPVRREEFAQPQMRGTTLVLQPGTRGMRLGDVTVVLDDKGRVSSFNNRVIMLPVEIEDAPRMVQWYSDYNAEVQKEYESESQRRKLQEQGVKTFVGADACQVCHVGSFKQWQQSHHAGALAKLQDVGKDFDPECIQCHSVGFERQGGFIDMQSTQALANVQCENCHGDLVGSRSIKHITSPATNVMGLTQGSALQVCGQCHNHSHSPLFDFGRYWPRIQHP